MARFGEKELGVQIIDRLITDTVRYWLDWNPHPDRIEYSLEKYIQDLLPREITAAQNIGNRLPDEAQKTDVLVLLVGFQFEPLLQSVCVYKPEKVLLVLNKDYGDIANGKTVGTWIESLIHKLPKNLLPQTPEIEQKTLNKRTGEEQFETCADEPDAVFQFLIDHLQRGQRGEDRARQQVVIDITGGKKSMVAGAYLFGALTKCKLSYVDFEEYDPKYHRPYGYSCKIGEIKNPYQTFQLASWGQVKRHYENYALGEARAALQTMLNVLAPDNEVPADGLFKPDDVNALLRLQDVLEFYEKWDAGDVPKAFEAWKSQIEQMGIDAPEVVEILGPVWEQAEQQLLQTQTPASGDFAKAYWATEVWKKMQLNDQNIWNNWQVMLSYVQDELAKIQRLADLKNEWRAAFIRSANLHEFSLKARLLILAKIGAATVLAPGSNDDLFECEWKSVSDALKALVKIQQVNQNDPPLSLRSRRGNVFLKPIAGVEKHHLTMPPNWERHVDRFRDVRNKTVHNLSIIPQNDADSAVSFVEQDWDNLLDHWAKLLVPRFLDEKLFGEYVKAKALREQPIGNAKFGLPHWKDLLKINTLKINFLPVIDEPAKQTQEAKS